ncbi:RNA-binding protein 41 [Lampris incognitus]|uniref:RNA-binding protein 41 n=1 Tax=Lampris incognitus TaxID=2546036 RepID=UPI0024B4911D|nr:RNA-binding protein 41 [Lampris incognitus]
MRRVSRHTCEEGPLLEEQETEGQRQLHGLLLQQLSTDIDINRCVAKKRCFAPAALYKPFGEQAVGVRSLSEFQALQDGEKELAGLRELGLTDTEIQLWLNKDTPEAAERDHGVCAAPGARQQRLQVIRDKMATRAALLSQPQRFSSSRPLSRREIEIERALFHGSHRQGFLTALYHQDVDNQEDQQGASSSDLMDCLYRDVLGRQASQKDSHGTASVTSNPPEPGSISHQSQHSQKETDQPQELQTNMDKLQSGQKDAVRSEARSDFLLDTLGGKSSSGVESESSLNTTDKLLDDNTARRQQQSAAPRSITVNQPIGSLRGAGMVGTAGPVVVRGKIENITNEEIEENRESDERIRNIPRFQNYQPGEPSKVLCVKNLSAQASVAQLVALFSRFEVEGGPPVLYRLLTGRLKGQAFITFADTETAQKALDLVHGYQLLGKPLVIEFGRERRGEEKSTEDSKNEKKPRENKTSLAEPDLPAPE